MAKICYNERVHNIQARPFYYLTNGRIQEGAKVVQRPRDVVYTNLSPFLYINYENIRKNKCHRALSSELLKTSTGGREP